MSFAPRSTDGVLSRTVVRFVGVAVATVGVAAITAGGLGAALRHPGYGVLGLLVGTPAVLVGVPLAYFAPGPVAIFDAIVAVFDLGRVIGWLVG